MSGVEIHANTLQNLILNNFADRESNNLIMLSVIISIALGMLVFSRMKIYAFKEGTMSFPREPLMRVQGPIAVAQLLGTPTLTLTNYPSLMTTNAAKYRLAVGFEKGLIEFGLRRAQGPDGGVSASRYSYMGGFDGTSDVLAGFLFGIPIRGTHAHSYVQSFTGVGDLNDRTLPGADGKVYDFVKMVLEVRSGLGFNFDCLLLFTFTRQPRTGETLGLGRTLRFFHGAVLQREISRGDRRVFKIDSVLSQKQIGLLLPPYDRAVSSQNGKI
jgi:putative nicotinate phosphoribosyltransferase